MLTLAAKPPLPFRDLGQLPPELRGVGLLRRRRREVGAARPQQGADQHPSGRDAVLRVAAHRPGDGERVRGRDRDSRSTTSRWMPGKHFLSGRAGRSACSREHLLDDPSRPLGDADARRTRRSGTNSPCGRRRWRLAAAAHGSSNDPCRAPITRSSGSRRPEEETPTRWSRAHRVRPDERRERRALRTSSSTRMDVRRRLRAAHAAARGRAQRRHAVGARAAGSARARGSASCVTLYNYAGTSRRARLGPPLPLRVVGAGDRRRRLHRRLAAVAERLGRRHDTAAALLLTHPVNRGLADARNSVLAFARGEFCFVLDADNEILPTAFRRCSRRSTTTRTRLRLRDARAHSATRGRSAC